MGASEPSRLTIAAVATTGFAVGSIWCGPIMGKQRQDAAPPPQSESGRKNLGVSIGTRTEDYLL